MHNLCNILACACKETVDKCCESSRGSCSPSKRPLLGGECPSNYIRKIQDVMETSIASLELYLFICWPSCISAVIWLKFAIKFWIIAGVVQGLSTSLQVCRTEKGFETIRIHDVYRVCTRSSEVCRQVMTNILNPYADRDIIRISEVFVLRRIQTPHSWRMKNCPHVECRQVSISMGAIYKAAYGTLSRRVYSEIKAVAYTVLLGILHQGWIHI